MDELDPNVIKTTILNFGFEAMLHGTKTIRKMRTVHNCNIPWLILMDPTSACNLHCTGCWAAEYGNKLNLSYDELSNVVKQGKELGVYFYMFTGGEPLVRKNDIIKLCGEHHECQFLAFTNGTLVDEAFCKEMKRVGNLALAISLEGSPEVNDLRVFLCIIQQELMKHLQNRRNRKELTENRRILSEQDLQDFPLHFIWLETDR